jgi:ABC-type transport system involved in multi-copper enzyme maturation permease subunit
LTKLRTQPSTFWSLLAAVILVTGFGVVYSLIRETRPPHGAAAFATFDPVGVSLSGVQLAQIAVGILGVLLITSEYATGMIRTTLSAVPGRLPVLWGKAILVAAATFAVSLPAALAAFVGGQSILAKQHLSVPLSQPGAVRAVVGSALYLAAIALLGLGLGALLRSTAAGIAALFGLLFGVQLVVGLLPWQWSQEAAKFAPTTAGQAVTTASPDPAYSLPPWAGLGVLVLYAVVLLGFAALRMRRGDA